LDVSVLRYFTVYGPAGRPDTTPLRFVQRIREGYPVYLYGDGSVQRDYTFSDDVARATTLALTPVGFEAINIGSDHPIAVIEAIRIVEEVVGRAAQLVYRPPHHADMRTTWADVRKAEALLDWRPKFSFKEGIRRLSDWYGANRDWAKEIKTQDD
jgi:nucleoside-diphosphate-sugar epimerase